LWANSTKGVENILSDTVVDKKKDFDKDKTLKSLKQKEKNPVKDDDVVVDLDATLQPIDFIYGLEGGVCKQILKTNTVIKSMYTYI
jgi:hypothetical protein